MPRHALRPLLKANYKKKRENPAEKLFCLLNRTPPKRALDGLSLTPWNDFLYYSQRRSQNIFAFLGGRIFFRQKQQSVNL